MTSLEQNFQNLRKESSQIFAKIMWSKFNKKSAENYSYQRPGQTDRQTDTQTDRHTDRHTHRQGSFRTKIFSHTEMTEYKKVLKAMDEY